SPELINEKPYQAWIFKYKPSDDDVSKALLSAEGYQAFLGSVA
ncbi:MAG: glycine cleavage system protein H, partial [Pseudomonadota bacterium]